MSQPASNKPSLKGAGSESPDQV